MSINLDLACRTCLTTEGGEMKSIYDQNKDVQISKMIMECTTAKVKDLDGLPTQICKQCVNDITIAFNFKQQCENSYQKLTEIIYQDELNDELVTNNSKGTKEMCTQTEEDVKPPATKMYANDGNEANAVKKIPIKYEINLTDVSCENDDGIDESMVLTAEEAEALTLLESEDDDNDTPGDDEQEDAINEENEIDKNDKDYEEKKAPTKKRKRKPNNRSSADGKTFDCDECDAKLDTESKYNFHKSRVHKKKVHQCETCQKTFTRATHLKRHQYTHSGIRPYSCEICGKSFNRPDHLHLHTQNHSATKSFFCGICHKSFQRSDTLRHHVDSIHSTNPPATPDKNFTCDVCEKAFATPKYLRIHKRVHMERKLSCKYCDQRFDTKQSMNNHLKLEHIHERPYLCSECGLRFVRNDYLVIHMRR